MLRVVGRSPGTLKRGFNRASEVIAAQPFTAATATKPGFWTTRNAPGTVSAPSQSTPSSVPPGGAVRTATKHMSLSRTSAANIADPSSLAGVSSRGSGWPISRFSLPPRIGTTAGRSSAAASAASSAKASRSLPRRTKPAARVQFLPVRAPARRGRLNRARPAPPPPLRAARLEAAHRGGAARHHHRVAHRILPRRPAIDPERLGEGTAARRLLGEKHIGIERRQGRRLDRHGPPVRAELVGDDLRQRGVDALPRLGLRHRDDHPPVPADLEEGVEQGLALAGAQIRPVVARPQAPRRRPARRSRRRRSAVCGG